MSSSEGGNGAWIGVGILGVVGALAIAKAWRTTIWPWLAGAASSISSSGASTTAAPGDGTVAAPTVGLVVLGVVVVIVAVVAARLVRGRSRR